MTAAEKIAFKKLISDFVVQMHAILNFYGDSVQGYGHVFRTLTWSQQQRIELFRSMGKHELATIEYLDQLPTAYVEEDASRFRACGTARNHELVGFSSLEKEVKQRNADGGDNSVWIANACVVLIYQLWEEKYRPLLEDLTSSAIQHDVFGELRQLRVSVLKNDGVVTNDAAKKINIIGKYKRGDKLKFSLPQLFRLSKHIQTALEAVESAYSIAA